MRRLAIALVLSSLSFAAAANAAPGGDQCARAAEEGQRLRDDAKLRAARPQFLECSRESCPAFIRNDCIKWLAEADAALPTVSVRARDSRGMDITGAKLDIDGVVVAESLKGQSIQLDPGEHMITVTARAGDKLGQKVVVVRGERDRILTFSFDRALEPDGRAVDGTGPRVVQLPSGARDTPPSDGASYALPITFTTIAVVGLATFTALDIHAYGRYSDLKDGCGATKSCTREDVSGLSGEFVGAAIALGVGLASAGLATYFFLTMPKKDGVRASIAPTPTGAAASLGGTF